MTEELKPILSKKKSGDWVTIDKKLIKWALRVSTRETISEYYVGVPNTSIDFVPCESGCGKKIKIGERAFFVQKIGVKADSAKRVFCSIECQRKNAVELKAFGDREDFHYGY